MSQYQDNSGCGSMVIGFILAIGNHTFGWFNSLLQVDGHIFSGWAQALITGSIGACGAFITNKLLKLIEKKIKNKKEAKKV